MAEVHITNNFYGNVGQQIDHIDHMEVHFDNDMQPQIASEITETTQKGLTPLCKIEAPAEPSATALCTYIIPNDIKSAEEIEQEMLAAARKNAPALANYIKHALRLGLIDLRGDDGKTVYENLKAHFGISYSYSNWMLYYS